MKPNAKTSRAGSVEQFERFERLEQLERGRPTATTQTSQNSKLTKGAGPRHKPGRPLLGAHMSIAGGVGNALLLGAKVDCDAIQIFTKSSRQWASKPYSKEEIEQFELNRKATGISNIIAHDSYLLNLGSSDNALRQRSILAFIDELERCETLGISHLIAHPGSHVGAGEDEGIKIISRSLDEIHRACPNYNVQVALEITAGQGSNLGYRFEHIARILDASKEPERLRVCFDTQHAFAAGYDIRTREGYERTFAEFDEIIGIDRLAAFHLNDSKKEFDSRTDRHEHIGKGHIGPEAFRMLMNDPRFWGLPMCLETPKRPDLQEDRENLSLLRSLIAHPQGSAPLISSDDSGNGASHAEENDDERQGTLRSAPRIQRE